MKYVRCKGLKHSNYSIVISLPKKTVSELPVYFFVDVDLDSIKERDKGE